MNSILQLKVLLGLLLLSVVLISNCQDNDSPDEEPPTWQHLGLEDKQIVRLRLYTPYLYACAGVEGLWRKDVQRDSSDWEYLGMADTTLEYFGVMDVVINSENDNEMLVAFKQENASLTGIYKTEDEGNTWFPSAPGGSYKTHPIIFLQTPYYLFAAGTWLIQTNDFGETWETNIPIASHAANTFRYDPKNNDILWIGGGSAFFSPVLLFSNNRGVDWDYIYIDTLFSGDNRVDGIAFDEGDSDIIYLNLLYEIAKTTDGGKTWSIIMDTREINTLLKGLTDDESQTGHLFIASGKTVLESVDEGSSWIDLESPNDGWVQSMVYDSENKALYIATGFGPTPKEGIFAYK